MYLFIYLSIYLYLAVRHIDEVVSCVTLFWFLYLYMKQIDSIDSLHKWCLNINNNTYTSLALHSCEKSFVLKYQPKDLQTLVPFM